MDYQAIDGRDVDVFFVTLSPPSARQTHLRVLGGIAGLVLQTHLLDRLREAENSAEIVEAFRLSNDELRAVREQT